MRGGVIGVGMSATFRAEVVCCVVISIKPYGIALWCVGRSLADDGDATVLIDTVLNVDEGA